MKLKIIDKSHFTNEDMKVEKSMPIWKAFMPWIILVILCIVTNFIPPVYEFLFSTLAMSVKIAGAKAVSLRVFWNAWFWVIIATVLSMPFLGVKGKLKDTFSTWAKRSIRPVFAAAIFFSIASVMNWSGATGTIGVNGLWELAPGNNMIEVLAGASSTVFGKYYPLIVPFIGLLGGFVSGSETSAIAMFSKYIFDTGRSPLLNLTDQGIVVMAASNGIGGGLASVLSPAKIQNATAVIDKQGIEGEVVKKTAPIAVLMVISVSIITLLWANEYVYWIWLIVFGCMVLVSILIGILLHFIQVRRKSKNEMMKVNEEEQE